MLYGPFRGRLRPHDQLALLLAALCHDLQHPGTNNSYMVNSGSALAAMTADAHVLEMHHSRVALQLLAASGALGGLPVTEQRAVLQTVTAGIINSDLALHSQLLDRCARRSGRLLESGAAEDRQLVVSLLLHAADLHTPLLNPALARPPGAASECAARSVCVTGAASVCAQDRKWTGRVFAEFASQAERERHLQLPVTVMQPGSPAEMANMARRPLLPPARAPPACQRGGQGDPAAPPCRRWDSCGTLCARYTKLCRRSTRCLRVICSAWCGFRVQHRPCGTGSGQPPSRRLGEGRRPDVDELTRRRMSPAAPSCDCRMLPSQCGLTWRSSTRRKMMAYFIIAYALIRTNGGGVIDAGAVIPAATIRHRKLLA